jgi:hypothetical protein
VGIGLEGRLQSRTTGEGNIIVVVKKRQSYVQAYSKAITQVFNFFAGRIICPINLALRQGKSFTHWQKVVNIMLEKEPGNPKICAPHLYKANYNLVLALQARKLVHHAEDNLLLNDVASTKLVLVKQPTILSTGRNFVGEITQLTIKPLIQMQGM